MARTNQWYGRRYSQWIELNLRKKFGDNWLLDNPPANFEVLQKYAQEHRFSCHPMEYSIANLLRKKGIPISHQVIYFNRYIADLALEPARTIIEIDGPYHHLESQKTKDAARDKVFQAFGFDVHRWPMNLSQEDIAFKVDDFARAHRRYAKSYPLKPICRPATIEKIFPDGIVQKALALKARK